MEIIELQEKAGYMYVNAEHRIVVCFGYSPKDDAHLWILTLEAEALALEAQWKAEDERKRLEEELRHSETYTS
jgi:hypothetical protein|uniref:Uncharacterized protein n=1 Tax=Myoviridae sp. ctO4916 TaxID=2826645 RepID=A0A8S5N4J5_9CAUD|nr:MAG TPA: hypothetical protein [Myoviridae sp. ctO4916]